MNKITLVVVLALIAAAIFVAFNYLPGILGPGKEVNFGDLSGVDANNFITYRDPSGFEIAYPYSFLAQAYDNASVPLKAVFSGASGGYGEAMEIAVSAQSPEAAKAQALLELTAEEKKTLVEGKAFNALVASFTTKLGEQAYQERMAVFACGSNSVVFTAAVPAQLKGDLNNVNYMISTFKCGALGS